FGLAVVGLILAGGSWEARAQRGSTELQWIWFNEGDPLKEAPAATRYFRRTFTVRTASDQKPVDEATLDVTADNAYTLYVNGVEVGKGDDWKRVQTYDVKKHLVVGKNVVAVAAKNTEGPAGLLVRLVYVPNGQPRMALVSDDRWKASKEGPAGWQKVDFDDRKWADAKALGAYGKVGPWKGLVWDKGSNERFTVPEGFKVEMAARTTDSLVNMTFDAKGRLLVSKENGPVLLCTDPDKNGVYQNTRPYCELVKNCQGMCWVKDALLLV